MSGKVDYAKSAEAICTNLTQRGIVLLALDFDLTIIRIHTGGRWPGTPEQLSTFIRPIFKELIPIAIQRNIFVTVVTFSPQTQMIRDVLKFSFPEHESQIVIRGDDKTWEYTGDGPKEGKLPYIASVSEEIETKYNTNIQIHQKLLVDDDMNNINSALQNGLPAIHCDPMNTSRMVRNLMGFDRGSSGNSIITK